jgi:hypothetical protein
MVLKFVADQDTDKMIDFGKISTFNLSNLRTCMFNRQGKNKGGRIYLLSVYAFYKRFEEKTNLFYDKYSKLTEKKSKNFVWLNKERE